MEALLENEAQCGLPAGQVLALALDVVANDRQQAGIAGGKLLANFREGVEPVVWRDQQPLEGQFGGQAFSQAGGEAVQQQCCHGKSLRLTYQCLANIQAGQRQVVQSVQQQLQPLPIRGLRISGHRV
ncbi:hypothetical protein D3C75_894280 [compost metagenome]